MVLHGCASSKEPQGEPDNAAKAPVPTTPSAPLDTGALPMESFGRLADLDVDPTGCEEELPKAAIVFQSIGKLTASLGTLKEESAAIELLRTTATTLRKSSEPSPNAAPATDV